jgi:hypothetical protein
MLRAMPHRRLNRQPTNHRLLPVAHSRTANSPKPIASPCRACSGATARYAHTSWRTSPPASAWCAAAPASATPSVPTESAKRSVARSRSTPRPDAVPRKRSTTRRGSGPRLWPQRTPHRTIDRSRHWRHAHGNAGEHGTGAAARRHGRRHGDGRQAGEPATPRWRSMRTSRRRLAKRRQPPSTSSLEHREPAMAEHSAEVLWLRGEQPFVDPRRNAATRDPEGDAFGMQAGARRIIAPHRLALPWTNTIKKPNTTFSSFMNRPSLSQRAAAPTAAA